MKELAKLVARFSARLTILPLYLIYRLVSFCCHSDNAFSYYSQLLALLPGTTGMYLRREFYRLSLKNCASDCFIGFGSIFSRPDVEICSQVYIGNYCNIGSAHIGAKTLIASSVHLISGTKQHKRLTNGDFVHSAFETIHIGESCWIGEAAVVAANVGAFSNIAAGAVVLKNVPDNVSVIGNPARVVSKELK